MRAAQSKGAFDLACFWPARPHGVAAWLVQCKTGSARMTPAEREKAVSMAKAVGALAVLAQPRKKGRRGIEFLDIETMAEIDLGWREGEEL